MSDMPVFFETPATFGRWLHAHHAREKALLVGFYKKGSGKPSLTWPESVAEALCVGWIDGVRKSLDEDSYTIRFTPRTSKSTWSTVNVKMAERLIAEGRMLPAGLAAFERRTERATAIYGYEQRATAELSAAHLKQLRANRAAHAYFEAQAPSYRHTVAYWIYSAKQEATRDRRLAQLIECSAAGRKVAPFLERKPPPDKEQATVRGAAVPPAGRRRSR